MCVPVCNECDDSSSEAVKRDGVENGLADKKGTEGKKSMMCVCVCARA